MGGDVAMIFEQLVHMASRASGFEKGGCVVVTYGRISCISVAGRPREGDWAPVLRRYTKTPYGS
jgi:hypothetical protein